jgi:nucleotide-binding universal stress UspA family protein
MDYKTILVHVDGSAQCRSRVDIGARLAHDFGAHLVGVHVTEPRGLPIVPPYAASGAELVEQWHAGQRRQAQQAAELFRERASRSELKGTEMRLAHGDPVDVLALHALYADLVVMGQVDPDEAGGTARRDLPDRTVLAIARPVLFLPYAATDERLGEHVLVAWDASRQAARSVGAALPLLRKARRVTVLVVNPGDPDGHGEVPGADVALFLARHGVEVEARCDRVSKLDVANWLLSQAFEMRADMIVMGAYRHSLVRERVFGGVTRSMLEQMTVPVLMEH